MRFHHDPDGTSKVEPVDGDTYHTAGRPVTRAPSAPRIRNRTTPASPNSFESTRTRFTVSPGANRTLPAATVIPGTSTS